MNYPAEPWTLVGRMDVSTFLVPRAALPAIDWPAGHRPLSLAGRVPVCAAWVDYAPGGTLSYRELLVAAITRRGTRVRPHVFAIWVDSPASRDGGRALWGIPKELAVFGDGSTCAVDGRVIASATLRRGPRLPGRPRVGFSVAQARGGSALVSPVVTRASFGPARARWWFDPDGALGFLAGRRPVTTASAHDFAMLFGMTPGDRALAGSASASAG